MKILWISGWAIPRQWVLSEVCKHLPDHNHSCIHSTNTTLEAIESSKVDLIVGYSLGANLLIRAKTRVRKILSAPFFDLKKESHLGGNVETARLKYMLKQFINHPERALDDFYNLVGMSYLNTHSLPYDYDQLSWGLETMLAEQSREQGADIPAFMGENDPLLNVEDSKNAFRNLSIIPQASHDLRTLLPAIKDAI